MNGVVTIRPRYVLDPYELADFEEYGRRCITLERTFLRPVMTGL